MNKCVRKPQQVLQQIHKRVLKGYFSQSALEKVQKYPVVKQEHQNGTVLAGVANFKQYKEVQLTEYILNINTSNNCIYATMIHELLLLEMFVPIGTLFS